MEPSKLEPEYADAYKAWQTRPDKQTAGRLLDTVDPIVSSAVRSYGGASAKSPTMKSHARSLAVDAFSTYDPTRGSLKSHLYTNLQRLQRISGQEQQIMRMPERVVMQRMELERSGRQLEDKLGRPPSDEELADSTGLSLKRLSHIRLGARPLTEGAVNQASDEKGFSPRVTERDGGDAWSEFVYSDMPKINQVIMERAMGLHGHKEQSAIEIARHLNITPAAVSQRMAKIQQQLDRRSELGML